MIFGSVDYVSEFGQILDSKRSMEHGLIFICKRLNALHGDAISTGRAIERTSRHSAHMHECPPPRNVILRK